MDTVSSDEFSRAMVEIARLAAAVDAANLQTQLALTSAEKLELERIGAVQKRLDVAADERASAAEVLRDELHRTAQAAAEEREKSAAALRAGTDQQLAALERLFTERVAALIALIESKSEQFNLLREADFKAIDKANDANEKRFESANEWRGQSADRERSQGEEMAKLASTFVRSDTSDAQFKGLRESIESQLGELRRMLVEMAEKINKVV